MVVDVDELERLYSKLNMPPESDLDEQHETDETDETDETFPNVHSETDIDFQALVDMLQEHLADTKTELKDAKIREKELLSLLKTEQEKTKMLMLPGSIKRPPKFSFWNYFRWKR